MAQSAIVEDGTPHEHEHPGELTYIKVAVTLSIITMIEVAIWYVDWVRDVGLLVPTLLILSSIKFIAVVGFFMHLKFDDRRFTFMFGAGLAVAASIILALMALFHWHGIQYASNLLT
jgi:cytochrome c oxidase subunit IV